MFFAEYEELGSLSYNCIAAGSKPVSYSQHTLPLLPGVDAEAVFRAAIQNLERIMRVG